MSGQEAPEVIGSQAWVKATLKPKLGYVFQGNVWQRKCLWCWDTPSQTALARRPSCTACCTPRRKRPRPTLGPPPGRLIDYCSSAPHSPSPCCRSASYSCHLGEHDDYGEQGAEHTVDTGRRWSELPIHPAPLHPAPLHPAPAPLHTAPSPGLQAAQSIAPGVSRQRPPPGSPRLQTAPQLVDYSEATLLSIIHSAATAPPPAPASRPPAGRPRALPGWSCWAGPRPGHARRSGKAPVYAPCALHTRDKP
jgi:hypothetical protein